MEIRIQVVRGINQSSYLTGIIQETDHRGSGRDDGSADNRNEHNQIFGNDTQIRLSSTSGDYIHDGVVSEESWSDGTLTSNLIGISQNSDERTTPSNNFATTIVNNSSQIFGMIPKLF